MGANATVLLTVANALTYNLQENHNKTTIEKIESLQKVVITKENSNSNIQKPFKKRKFKKRKFVKKKIK